MLLTLCQGVSYIKKLKKKKKKKYDPVLVGETHLDQDRIKEERLRAK